MELICKIIDEDIGEVSIKMYNPRLRLGARGFVVLRDRKILEKYIEISSINRL